MNKTIFAGKGFLFFLFVLLLVSTSYAESLQEDEVLTNDDFDISVKVIEIGTENNESYVDLDIFYSDRDSYVADVHGGNNGFVPNPGNYPGRYNSNLFSHAKVLYRTHYFCDDKLMKDVWSEGLEKIYLSDGYSNYLCRNRKQEQCYRDGSFDSYYGERCDYGVVRFYENDIKSTDQFSVEVSEITEDSVDVVISAKEERSFLGRLFNKDDEPKRSGLSEEDKARFREAIQTILEIFAKIR